MKTRVLSLTLLTIVWIGANRPLDARQITTLSGGVQSLYKAISGNVLAAAELMPEESYGFRPTPDVRSFGELVGHLTNTQYNFCAPVRPDVKPVGGNHERLKTKAELVAALKGALEYCDAAYAATTTESLAAPAKFGSAAITAGYTLIYNIAHDNEHYGNMVTYLRLKGLVPPSSARR